MIANMIHVGNAASTVTAIAGGPYTGMVGETIHFNAIGSHSSSTSAVLRYDWQFSSDDQWLNDLGPTPTNVYSTAGTYTVTLRVTDDQGSLATDTATVTITQPNLPPTTPIITEPRLPGQHGESYQFTFASNDPEDGNIRYYVDWGDGTTNTSDVVPNGSVYTISHVWTETNVYPITAYTTDPYDASSGTATYLWAVDAPEVSSIGYLIDHNGDSIYDSFYNATTHRSFAVQEQTNGTYLLDVNGDGTWDYRYDPQVDTLTVYSAGQGTVIAPSTPTTNNTMLIIGGVIAVIVIIAIVAVVLFFRKK